jgi:hypothetical protein
MAKDHLSRKKNTADEKIYKRKQEIQRMKMDKKLKPQ